MKYVAATDSFNNCFVGWTLAGSTWLLTHTDSLKLLFSFGQKAFYISNMGETALEEEPRGTLNIMIFLKINHLPIV
jgi:hypothetical protein